MSAGGDGGRTRLVAFDEAETYEPEEGWRRVAVAGDERFSFEWFEKPGPLLADARPRERAGCVVLGGELTVHTEDDAVTLGRYDSVLLEWEAHRVENTGDVRAVGLDVFVPGRSFDFWTDREE